jgi:hypothetical protein
MPVLFPWLAQGREMAQPKQGKLRIRVSQKKIELTGRHWCMVQRELLFHLKQRQTHPP